MAAQRSISRRSLFCLVLIVGALFLLPGLHRSLMTREQELRVALTAREMVQSGDWLRPEYLGEPRLRKPPLMYWAVAAAYELAGTTRSAAVARLPSALAGLALMALVYTGAARSMGRRRGATAALLCGTALIFLKQARLAETDVLLCLGVTGAAFALYDALNRGTRGSWWIAGLWAGLGFLAKGPAALALPLAAGITFSAFTRAARPAWRNGHAMAALGIFVLLALPWYIMVLRDGPAWHQIQDELRRAAADSEHKANPLYYAYTLFHALAPWSLLLPWALVRTWRRNDRAIVRFALAWFTSTLLVLSLLDSKQIHYALLLAPPAAVLVAYAVGGILSTRRAPHRGLVWSGGLAALWLIHMTVNLWILPAQNKWRVIPEALAEAEPALTSARRLHMAGPRNAIAEFYAGRPVETSDTPERAWSKARAGDAVIVVQSGNSPHRPLADYPPLILREEDQLRCEIRIKP